MRVKEGMPITALALIVIGVMCFIFRTGMLSVLITVIGAVLIATGLYDIFVRKNTFLGIAEAVAGAIAVIFGWTLAGAALVITAIVFRIVRHLSYIRGYKFRRHEVRVRCC